MKTWQRVVGLGTLAAVAVSVVAYRSLAREQEARAQTAAVGRGNPQASSPRVVLIAELSEAEEECGCGQIIRMVRAAALKGVAVRELDTEKEPEAGRQYGVTVAPAVVLLGEKGQVTQRLVGEEAETIEAIRQALRPLETAAP
jgi:hypothetical protein